MTQATNSNSNFCCIPDEIGDISYSKSTTDQKSFNLFKSLLNAVIWTVVVALIVLWTISRIHDIPILTIAILVVALVLLVYGWIKSFTFEGYDCFIGSKGFVIVHFKGSKKRFKKEVYLFSDITEIKFIDKVKYVAICGRGSEKPVKKIFSKQMADKFWDKVEQEWVKECNKRRQIYQMVVTLLDYEDE